jgi:hypothetical protein
VEENQPAHGVTPKFLKRVCRADGAPKKLVFAPESQLAANNTKKYRENEISEISTCEGITTPATAFEPSKRDLALSASLAVFA